MSKPLFQRRHYQLLAQLLQQHDYIISADQLIKVFRTDNPDFDEHRFKKALNGNKK